MHQGLPWQETSGTPGNGIHTTIIPFIEPSHSESIFLRTKRSLRAPEKLPLSVQVPVSTRRLF